MSEHDEVQWPERTHPVLSDPYPVGTFGHRVFGSARTKMKRAEEVIEDLKLRAGIVKLDFDDALRVDLSSDGTKYQFRVDDPPPLPTDWAVKTGEVLYNMRSALDHVAFELSVRALGRDLDPSKEAGHSQFPIYKKVKSFRDNRARNLPGLDDDIMTLIERVQPYPERTREYGPTQFDEAAFWLGLLNRLGNVDKHRQPHLFVRVVGEGAVSWSSGNPEPRLFDGPIEAGRVIAEMDYYPSYVPYRSVHPRFGFHSMLMDDAEPLTFPNVLGVIHLMVKRVIDVLDPSPFYSTWREEMLRPVPQSR